MQIKLGQKIRELRRRDGITQEELASALSVTSQAVSRWESGGGYPDTEILPSIANYFHVTIDELFGYNGDREEKIRKILAEAEEAINRQGDMTDCVAMLREAAVEFPLEGQILLKLGYALQIYGWQKFGLRGFTEDGSDYTHADVEYNSKNTYWQEAVRIFERLLSMEMLSPDDREAVILLLVIMYQNMGEIEKAKALCARQPSIIVSRERLLPNATAGEERDQYIGEALITLLREFWNLLRYGISSKMSVARTDTAPKHLLALANLYETIFEDGNCGAAHHQLWEIYFDCATYEGRLGNIEKGMEYFEKSFSHAKAYQDFRAKDVFHYTAPLVSKVTAIGVNHAKIPTGTPENFWRGWMELLSKDLLAKIKADGRYAECFL